MRVGGRVFPWEGNPWNWNYLIPRHSREAILGLGLFLAWDRENKPDDPLSWILDEIKDILISEQLFDGEDVTEKGMDFIHRHLELIQAVIEDNSNASERARFG